MKARITWLYYKLGFCILTMLLSCCAHDLESKQVMGMPARECGTIVRKLVCVDNLTAKDCSAFMEAADAMNAELGFEFFQLDGKLYHDPEPTLTSIVITYKEDGPDKPNNFETRQKAMVTAYRFNKTNNCMMEAAIIVMMPTEHFSRASLDTLFRHELGHTLGLPHEEEGVAGLMQTGFPSDLDEPVFFNAAELSVLKAAYPFIDPLGWR